MAGNENPFTIDPSTFMGAGQSFTPAPAAQERAAASANPAGGQEAVPGVGNLEDVFQILQAESERTTAIARDTTRQVGAVAADVRSSAAKYNQAAQRTAAEADRIEASRAEAARLASSNNPLDRLNLIGAQTFNPQDYTREGRTNRMTEMNQLLSMRGQVHNVKVAEGQARIGAIEANASIRMAQGEGAYDRLQTRLTALQTTMEAGQVTEQLRTTQLSRQSLTSLQTTLATDPDPMGYYQLGEFKYTETELLEREENVRRRKLLASLPINGYNEPQLAAYQQTIIDTMSLDDLTQIRDSGYMHEGTQFTSEQVESAIQTRRIAESERLAVAMTDVHTTAGTIRKRLTSAVTKVDEMLQQHGPETPIGKATLAYSQRMADAQIMHERGIDQTPEGMKMVLEYTSLAEAEFRESITAAIENEQAEIDRQEKAEAQANRIALSTATRDAGGDKALIPLLVDQAMGIPVDPSKVFNYVADNYSNSRPFARAPMPTADVARLSEVAQANFARLEQQAAGSGWDAGRLTVAERKELRLQAMTSAWETVMNEKGIDAVSTAVQASMTPLVADMKLAPNPLLAAGIAQGEYRRLSESADNIAGNQIAADNNLSLDQWVAVKEGRHDEVDISTSQAEELRSQYNVVVTMAMYDELERVSPGLGERYTGWMTKNLPKLATRVMEANDPAAAVFARGANERALDTIGVWNQANESATQRQQQLAVDSALQMGKPETILPAAITMVNDITDQQKAQVWTQVITPILDLARKEGKTDEEALEMVMAELEIGRSDNPVLTQASKKILRALPQVISSVRATHQSVMHRVMANTWQSGRMAVDTLTAIPSMGPNRADAAVDRAAEQYGQGTFRAWKNQPIPWMPQGGN